MNNDQLEQLKDSIDRISRQQQRQLEQPNFGASLDRALGNVAASLVWWVPRVILGFMILNIPVFIWNLVWLIPQSRIGVAEQSAVLSDSYQTDEIHGLDFLPAVPNMVQLDCPMRGKVLSIVKVGTHVEPDTIICTIESEEDEYLFPIHTRSLTSRYEAGVTGEVIEADAGDESVYPRFKINTAKPSEIKKPEVKLNVEEPHRPIDNVLPVIPGLSKPEAKPNEDGGRWTIYGLPENKPAAKPESKPVQEKSNTDPEFK